MLKLLHGSTLKEKAIYLNMAIAGSILLLKDNSTSASNILWTVISKVKAGVALIYVHFDILVFNDPTEPLVGQALHRYGTFGSLQMTPHTYRYMCELLLNSLRYLNFRPVVWNLSSIIARITTKYQNWHLENKVFTYKKHIKAIAQFISVSVQLTTKACSALPFSSPIQGHPCALVTGSVYSMAFSIQEYDPWDVLTWQVNQADEK